MRNLLRTAYFAFLLTVPIETVDFFQKQGESRTFSFSRLLGFFVLALSVVEWRRCYRRLPPAFWLIAGYIAYYTASQLWLPPELDEAFFKKQVILYYCLALYLVTANLFEDAPFRAAALRLYGWWTTVVGAAMMLGAFGAPKPGMEGRNTIMGQDPNAAAALFAAAAMCVAGDPRNFERGKSATRLLVSGAAVIVLALAILDTGSRGGLLAFIAGILALGAAGGKITRKQRLFIAGGLAVALTGLIVREFRNGTTTAERLSDSWYGGDTAGRTEIYDMAWTMFRERPLLGYGGANNSFTLGLRLNFTHDGAFVRDTHNLMLALLTEVGLAGSTPFALALLLAGWGAWRHGRRTGDALPLSLLCVELAINGSLTGTNQVLFWIVLAAATACRYQDASMARAAAPVQHTDVVI